MSTQQALIQALRAYRDGDFSVRLDASSGVDPELVEVFNEISTKANAFQSEIGRVTHEVGVAGSFGARVCVPNVSGGWKNIADSMNTMTTNLDDQFRSISTVTTAIARGDLSQKIAVRANGGVGELINVINGMVDQLNTFASELVRTTRDIGSFGKLGTEMNVPADGSWNDMKSEVNVMSQQIAAQFRLISNVTTEVARGNLSVSIETQHLNGEILSLANVINTMTLHLKLLSDRLSLVALEIGSKGKLGGYIKLRGIEGVWKDLIDNFNTLARNTTSQVRALNEVTGAVARGDLGKVINLDLQGESLDLKNTVNSLVNQMATFTSEIARVSREVGTEGVLGSQIAIQGLSGVWETLVVGLNTMVMNITNQIRSIAEVVAAFLQGDFTRNLSMSPDSTNGEIATLKTSINQLAVLLKDYMLNSKDGENNNTNLPNSRKRSKLEN